jgi:hypothetical protein
VPVVTNHRSEIGFIVSLTLVAESLERLADGVRFQCDCGDAKIVGGITDAALLDLVDFHRVKSATTDASRVLLAEIERLVNAKCDAGRFEEDGGLMIRPVDLLRYGFQRQKKRAA